jgi:hypothetical protein
MSQSRPTVLMMARGVRVHHIYREMAAALSVDHRVVVLALPEEVPSFRELPGVDVRPYRTEDVHFPVKTLPPGDESVEQLRARAAEIETEIGLPVYKAMGNYLLYGRIVRSFGGYWRYLDNERDILQTYVNAYRDLAALFDEIHPDVVFFDTIDLISNFIAFTLARKRGIFALDFRFSPLSNGKISTGFGLYRKSIVLEHIYSHPSLITPASYAVADDMLARRREYLYGTAYATVNKRMFVDNNLLNGQKLFGALFSPRRWLSGGRNMRWHLRGQANRAWLSRHLSRSLPQDPYVLFFLPHLPEASTCSQAPRWAYIDAIVEQLAINAPSGLKIVIKEHPRTYGRRGKSFFEPLQALPNVLACHPQVDSYKLVAGAEAILAVTGNVGLEGILMGKRVGVLGRPYYSAYRGLRCLNTPEEIFDVVADPAYQPGAMHDEQRRFFAAYAQSLHDFGYGSDNTLLPRTGGARWADVLRSTKAFIDEHRLAPSDFDDGVTPAPASEYSS